MGVKYRTNPFYNGVSSFKAAFPDLNDANVEWRELRGPEDARGPESRKTGFRKGNFTQGILPCSNPACHEGGYQVDRLIAQMIRDGETEKQGMMLCSGREVGEEVRRGPIRCPYRIEYTVRLSPRSADEPEPRGRRQHNRQHGRHRQHRRSSAA